MALINYLTKNNNFKIYIFGAQVIAYGAYVAIKELAGITPANFIVSSVENNPTNIDGIGVCTPQNIDRDAFIIVAVTALLQREILTSLELMGFNNVFLLTQNEEFKLMEAYFSKINKFPTIKFDGNKEKKVNDMVLYEVRNIRDAILSKKVRNAPYEISIQAGAVVSEKHIADFMDSTGINISEKNKQYCEMTATYWVWKNGLHQWTGIEHYRRHLMITPEVLTDEIDVVLPLPYICYPNTMAQFRRFVSEEVKEALFKALKHIHPNEYEDYCEILYGKYQYTYNIFCARKYVFNNYCKWFFEITEFIETMADDIPEIKTTRALSYVAEVLTNLYYMYNKKQYNILHTGLEIYN